MDTTWIEVGGLAIRAPVTAGTNLLLAIQCAAYYRWMRTGRTDRRGLWALFFLTMAVAQLGGVPKHGMRHLLGDDALLTLLWISNLASGASIYFAQRATITSHASARARPNLEHLSALQAVLFFGANVAWARRCSSSSPIRRSG